jgi:hypothetical protein
MEKGGTKTVITYYCSSPIPDKEEILLLFPQLSFFLTTFFIGQQRSTLYQCTLSYGDEKKQNKTKQKTKAKKQKTKKKEKKKKKKRNSSFLLLFPQRFSTFLEEEQFQGFTCQTSGMPSISAPHTGESHYNER